MSDEHDNPVDVWSEGVLVRLAADGELTPEQAEQWKELLARKPELLESVEFEKGLREATGRVMGSVVLPAGLRDRVQASIRADDEVGEGIASLASETRSRGFWQRRRLIGALAAVVVLTMTAGILWQALTITRVPLNEMQLAHRQELVAFVSSEHARATADDEARNAKLILHEASEAENALAEKFSGHIMLPDCEQRALRFLGAGLCRVPGVGPSAHVMLQPDVGPTLSLFVRRFSGELPMVEGKTYVVDTRACGEPGTRIFTWIEGDLMYILVLEEVKGCEKVLGLLGRSLPSRGL